jgi:hypothetical protein
MEHHYTPIHKKEIILCKKCILPSNYPGITFNEKGVCNYCLDYKASEYLGEQAFVKLLDSIKSKGNQYDCLIPISGGRDSTFVLYQMKNKFNLNVLAYNYDNGFVSSVARENIQRAKEKLDVELISLKSRRDIQCKNLRHVIKLNLHKSPAHVIPSLCEGCSFGIWGGAYKVAKEKGIPLVVFGESTMESGTAKKIIGRKLRPAKKQKIKYALKMPVNFLFRKYHSILLENEFPLHDFTDIKKVNYYDYFEWDENEILDVIQNKLAWRIEENMSSWRFDCKIHAVVNYIHKKLYGFTEKDELYSKMIRENKITRNEALSKISSRSENDKRELEVITQVFDTLGLSHKEREAILNLKTLS